MFFAFFLELYSSSSYNKGRVVFAIIRYVLNTYVVITTRWRPNYLALWINWLQITWLRTYEWKQKLYLERYFLWQNKNSTIVQYYPYIVCIFLYERTLWFLFLCFTDNRSHYEFRWTPTERRLLATWIDDFAPLGLKYTRWIEWSGCYGIVRKSKYTIIMHKNFVKIVFISAIFSKISWNLFTIYELKRSRCLWSFVRKSSWKKITSKYS